MDEILKLTVKVQDYYYTSIGEMYRNRYQTYFLSQKRKITPPLDLFFGPFAPSEIFPDTDVLTRGQYDAIFSIASLSPSQT